jgi:hypothetical protein
MIGQDISTTWQLQQFYVFSWSSLFCFHVSFPSITQAMFCSSCLSFAVYVAFHACSESSCNDDSAFQNCFLMFSLMLNFFMSAMCFIFFSNFFFFGIFISYWSRYFTFANSSSLSPFSFCVNVLFPCITLEIHFYLLFLLVHVLYLVLKLVGFVVYPCL